MKYSVARFKSLKEALKQLEPFIRNGKHLETGRPFKLFGRMLSREVLGNWLLCVIGNFTMQDDQLTFSSDPVGGDGIIYNIVTEEGWRTEHVLARGGQAADVDTLILKA